MWSLTLTDIHTGWTELAGFWGKSGREVCVGLRRIGARVDSKVRKIYDIPQTPCDRLLACHHVSEASKRALRKQRAASTNTHFKPAWFALLDARHPQG